MQIGAKACIFTFNGSYTKAAACGTRPQLMSIAWYEILHQWSDSSSAHLICTVVLIHTVVPQSPVQVASDKACTRLTARLRWAACRVNETMGCDANDGTRGVICVNISGGCGMMA